MTPKYRVRADWKMQEVYALKRCGDWLHVLAGSEQSSLAYRPWEYELMQWTWLQDMDWVDIYEGDIVYVIWTCHLIITMDKVSKLKSYRKNWKYFVVKKNKYEHPHLLDNIH